MTTDNALSGPKKEKLIFQKQSRKKILKTALYRTKRPNPLKGPENLPIDSKNYVSPQKILWVLIRYLYTGSFQWIHLIIC